MEVAACAESFVKWRNGATSVKCKSWRTLIAVRLPYQRSRATEDDARLVSE